MDTPEILVIGYGNSLAGDDALGFYTVQKLVGSELPANVTVKYIHQLMPEHAEDISQFDIIIFIDAEESNIDKGNSAGTMNCRLILQDDIHDTSSSAHEFSLDSILLISKELYGKIPETYLITVTGKNFLTGDRLTPEVEASVPEVINTVYNIINRKNHGTEIPVF